MHWVVVVSVRGLVLRHNLVLSLYKGLTFPVWEVVEVGLSSPAFAGISGVPGEPLGLPALETCSWY